MDAKKAQLPLSGAALFVCCGGCVGFYQAFPSEGKACARRTAVDEVEKRWIKVCYWFSAILKMRNVHKLLY